ATSETATSARWHVSRVAIIGPGRVGTLLGIALSRSGHRTVAVAGGSSDSRDRFTSLVAGVRPFEHPGDAAALAELIVVAVPDDALDDVVTMLAVSGAIGEADRV